VRVERRRRRSGGVGAEELKGWWEWRSGEKEKCKGSRRRV